MNLCRSVEVAFNVFHMFKGNTINMVRLPDAEGFNYDWKQFVGKKSHRLEEDQPEPYNNDHLELVSSLLEGECSEVRVHEVETFGGEHEPQERRLVQFIINSRRSGMLKKRIFSVTVGCQFCDGDEVSGWSGWAMKEVTLETCDEEKCRFRLKTSGMRSDDLLNRHSTWMSDQMKENFGRLVCFEKF